MYGLHRNHLPPEKRSTLNRDMMRYPGPALRQAQGGGRSLRQTANPDAMKKITALESELLKLRAQIAMIVTVAPASGTGMRVTSLFTLSLTWFHKNKQLSFNTL